MIGGLDGTDGEPACWCRPELPERAIGSGPPPAAPPSGNPTPARQASAGQR